MPTIVDVHGGPLGAWAPAPSIEVVLLCAAGYRVVLPNIRGSAGYGRDWIRPQLGDWGGVDAADVHAAEYEEVFPNLQINETSYVIIVTRGHRDDMRVLKLAIATPARYIAMIGSKRKVLNVIRELEKEGIPRAAFERIHAPMGLNIGAVSPEEIAISVAAEMIAVRRGAASNWRSLSMSVFADESLRAVLAK